MPAAATPATSTSDPEARFSVADPGKEWRRGLGIPVVRAFDGYRALAVVAVVLFHVLEVTGVTHRAGDSVPGVLIWGVLPGGLYAFFIVSGFVMFLPTVAREGDFGRVGSFAIRRAARLLPAYWLALIAALVIVAVFGSVRGFPDAGTIISHVTVVQGEAMLFVNQYSLGFGVIAPVWTLSIEVIFYLLLPLVAVSYFRHPLVGLGVAAALVVGWHELATHASAVVEAFGGHLSDAANFRIQSRYASQFPNWAFAIASGMTAAWAYVRMRDRVRPETLERWAVRAAAPIALALAALFVVLAGLEAVNGAQFNGLFANQSLGITLAFPAALAAAFLAVAFLPGRVQRPVTNAPIRWLADISYGVYLIHLAVIWLLQHPISLVNDGSVGSVLAWTAIVFTASIGYAYLSARFLERPVRRWAHRFGRRAQEARQVGATA